jgi:hypothetical protein
VPRRSCWIRDVSEEAGLANLTATVSKKNLTATVCFSHTHPVCIYTGPDPPPYVSASSFVDVRDELFDPRFYPQKAAASCSATTTLSPARNESIRRVAVTSSTRTRSYFGRPKKKKRSVLEEEPYMHVRIAYKVFSLRTCETCGCTVRARQPSSLASVYEYGRLFSVRSFPTVRDLYLQLRSSILTFATVQNYVQTLYNYGRLG